MNHPSPLRHDADAKLPAAAYLRYESRADGWSAGRQAAFLSHLADNGLVEDAARSVGMSVSGGYSLRRTSRGYAFNLGWEAALIIARRVISDRLMTAAIKGEEARWVREEGVTTYTRQNTKLSLVLLDRINPATTLSEVMAVASRFDWYLQLIDEGARAQELWDLFFDDALPHSDIEARARVRASLLLSEESAGFEEEEEEEEEDEPPIEYKSMEGPPKPSTPPAEIDPHLSGIAAIGVETAFDDAALPLDVDQHHGAAARAIDRGLDENRDTAIVEQAFVAQQGEQYFGRCVAVDPAGKRGFHRGFARPGLARMAVGKPVDSRAERHALRLWQVRQQHRAVRPGEEQVERVEAGQRGHFGSLA